MKSRSRVTGWRGRGAAWQRRAIPPKEEPRLTGVVVRAVTRFLTDARNDMVAATRCIDLNTGDDRVKEEGMQSILRGGQVMDVATGEVAPADVLIDGERIAGVARSHEFGSDNGAAVIDITGLTI